jgi:hypothetical protein
MPLWVWMLLLIAIIKLPIAGLLLWLPYRYDESMQAPEQPDSSSEDDGGSKVLPGGPREPHPRKPLPRLPRRGPHGGPSPASPSRLRPLRGRQLVRSR